MLRQTAAAPSLITRLHTRQAAYAPGAAGSSTAHLCAAVSLCRPLCGLPAHDVQLISSALWTSASFEGHRLVHQALPAAIDMPDDLTACLAALLFLSRALRFCAAVSFACSAGPPASLLVPFACTTEAAAASASFAMASHACQTQYKLGSGADDSGNAHSNLRRYTASNCTASHSRPCHQRLCRKIALWARQFAAGANTQLWYFHLCFRHAGATSSRFCREWESGVAKEPC